MTASLVDIGLNLAHESFDSDRDAVLSRAAAAGVEYMLITGSSLDSTRAAIEFSQQHPTRLRATAGIHPHHASDFPDSDRDALRDLLLQPEVIAAGECGLDYFRNFSSHSEQERVFRLQLELACETHKPLFLHQRDAHDPFAAILQEYLPRANGGVAHCFTADLNIARTYLDLGLYIGITGWLCDERRGAELRDAVRYVPIDRLLLETDAPYLLPRSLPRNLQPKTHSRRNEPMLLPHVLQTLAAFRNESVATLAAATTHNARRLFGWPQF